MSASQEAWFAEAEKKLGRKLHPYERHIDVRGWENDLRVGKARLAAAIEKERNAAIRRHLAGKPNWRPKITQEMVDALAWLYDRGQAHADSEMVSMGLLDKQFASRGIRRKLGKLFTLLGEMIGQIGFRIQREAPVIKARFDANTVQSKLATAMEKKVPGSLDAASRLVSTAIAEGLDDRYLDRIELFNEMDWIITAIMDGATCDVCKSWDGTRFAEHDEAYAAVGGLPIPTCRGDGRCRCRILPVPRKRPQLAA